MPNNLFSHTLLEQLGYEMQLSRRFMTGFALAVCAYILLVFLVPSDAAEPHVHSTDGNQNHIHVDAADVEPLTGAFGTHGDRHPQAQKFNAIADGLTERRRRTMSAMSAHFRVISATLLSDAGGEEMLHVHADALAALAQHIDALFETVSPAPDGEKGALAGIWDQQDTFTQYTAAFNREAARFAATVHENGDLVNGLHDLRYFCVACHAEFRQR